MQSTLLPYIVCESRCVIWHVPAVCFNGLYAMFVPAFFVCSDGEVLPHSWVCDGFEDCMDGSDEAASKYCNGEGCLVTIGLGCDLDLEFSWSNMEFTLSRPKMVRLP